MSEVTVSKQCLFIQGRLLIACHIANIIDIFSNNISHQESMQTEAEVAKINVSISTTNMQTTWFAKKQNDELPADIIIFDCN